MAHISLKGSLVGVVCALSLAGSAIAASSIKSDFETSIDGWSHAGASVFQQNAAGGNPGGHLYIDNSEGPITYIFAPAKFLGDLSAYDGGSVSFDGNMLGIGGTPYTAAGLDYGHLTLFGGGTSATIDLLPAPGQPLQNAWTTFSAALTAADWNKSQADWMTLLANVTAVQLSVEAMFGGEVQGIDNFTVSAIPEPHTWLMLSVGLGVLGWIAQRRN